MGSDSAYGENFYTPNQGVVGYVAYYLRKNKKENSLNGMPLTLLSKIIAPELKESFESNFDVLNGQIPYEEDVDKWIESLDKCISCGKKTPYTINTHIDQRKNYIEGAGQLCAGCYEEFYEN